MTGLVITANKSVLEEKSTTFKCLLVIYVSTGKECSGLDTGVEQLWNQKLNEVDQNWSKTNVSVAMLGCEKKEGILAVPKTGGKFGESTLKPGRNEEFMEAVRDRNQTKRQYYWRQYCSSRRKVAKTGQVCVCGGRG